MLNFLADENVNPILLAQLRRHLPGIDIVHARDVGLAQTPDQDIFRWAADNERVVVSHDKKTMWDFTNGHLTAGLPMPGLMLWHYYTPIGAAIRVIMVYAMGVPGDIDGQVVFI